MIHYLITLTIFSVLALATKPKNNTWELSYYNVGNITQTDNTPCITADLLNLCEILEHERKLKYVAVPQYLYKKNYRYILLDKSIVKPEFYYLFDIKDNCIHLQIRDVMNKRYDSIQNNNKRIDFAVSFNEGNNQIKDFGLPQYVKNNKVTLLKKL